jgi:hypothetical protein
MGFWDKLRKKAKPKKAPSADDIFCLRCGTEFGHLGKREEIFRPRTNLFGDGSWWDLKYAAHHNVCPDCKIVVCRHCKVAGGPTPCPKCGRPTCPTDAPGSLIKVSG